MNKGISAGVAALVGAAAVVLVAGIAVGAMWVFGWGMFQQSTAEHRGETAQKEQVRADPDYRIAAYERFFDLCASVRSDEATIANLEEELADDPTAERESQIKASLTAVRSNRSETINEYNADARKSETAAAFRSSDLPYQLDPDSEETRCTAD